MVKSRRY